LDFIYSKDLINKTKIFFKILIKEWMNFIKVGGKIIIDFKENKILSFEELKKEILLFKQRKARIVLENCNKKECRIIFVKNKKRS